MRKANAVGLVVHSVRKEGYLGCNVGMGVGNYRGCQQEYISDVLGGHACIF